MDNERDVREREEERLSKKVNLTEAGKLTGYTAKTLRDTFVDSAAKFKKDKLNTTRIGGKGHHRVSVREIERFVRDNTK